MSSYVLMKILESTPSRYDRGIRILTLGKLDAAYDRLASLVREADKVLDIGCGTGALTLRAARMGASVKGIDINPQMLEIAHSRAASAGLDVQLSETGVAELAGEASGTYDVVMSGLCFSELSEDELRYSLREIERMLKPHGRLLVADEAVPVSALKRIVGRLVRIPLMVITYIATQTGTSAVKNLPKKVKEAGFRIESVRLNGMGSFIELVATKHDEA